MAAAEGATEAAAEARAAAPPKSARAAPPAKPAPAPPPEPTARAARLKDLQQSKEKEDNKKLQEEVARLKQEIGRPITKMGKGKAAIEGSAKGKGWTTRVSRAETS